MEKSLLDDARERYMIRRILFLLSIVLLIAIVAVALVFFSSEGTQHLFGENQTMVKNDTEEPPEIAPAEPEEEPEIEEEELLSETEVIIPPDEAPCLMAPLEELGCLNLMGGRGIFGVYGLSPGDKNVKRVTRTVERQCNVDEGQVDIDCIVDTAVYGSENSWVCEWDCLEDIGSCEIYKTHLAVAVARKFVPATDIFVAQTENFNFFVLEKKGDEWIAKFKFTNSPIVAIYNDLYYTGEPLEVVFPDIVAVEPGDTFCFDFHSNASCLCRVEVQTFHVGDCPQLPADLRSICDRPIEDIYISRGTNRICFNVLENATEEFYTYNFVLTSGTDFLPTGDAFVKIKQHECCVEGLSFKGFLSIED